MSHVRTQIRQAVVAALEPLGGVHASRFYPIQPDELPVLLVYMGDEEMAGDFQNQERTLRVIVEIVADGQFFDDTLDDQLVGVEETLSGDLDGLVRAFYPVSVEVSAGVEGANTIGRARVTFEALYRTSYTDSETSI